MLKPNSLSEQVDFLFLFLLSTHVGSNIMCINLHLNLVNFYLGNKKKNTKKLNAISQKQDPGII